MPQLHWSMVVSPWHGFPNICLKWGWKPQAITIYLSFQGGGLYSLGSLATLRGVCILLGIFSRVAASERSATLNSTIFLDFFGVLKFDPGFQPLSFWLLRLTLKEHTQPIFFLEPQTTIYKWLFGVPGSQQEIHVTHVFWTCFLNSLSLWKIMNPEHKRRMKPRMKPGALWPSIYLAI